MSYFELDFSIDFSINVEHQCVQLHLPNAVQFSDFLQALQQARLQPHFTCSWQANEAMLTSGIDIQTGRSLFSISYNCIQVDLEPSFQQHLLMPKHLLDTVPVDNDGMGHSVLE